MVRVITLPISSETCDKISNILLHVLFISGLPALGFGIFYLSTAKDILLALFGTGLTICGMVLTLIFSSAYGGIIIDFYDKHKIIFKCSCKQQNNKGVKA